MVDIEKPELPIELEKGSSHVDKSGIEYERAQLLANLPDPDAGKTDEERKEIDKKLMRKVDLWLIPWLSLLYLLSFLDRTNIGNARLEGMELDLGMVEGNYNMALTIFFIGYAVAEPITNALLKRLTPRIFFTGIIVVWGIIMTLMGLCKNNAGLLAARWFLGIAEAGLFPGVNYYLSCWYKSSEIGVRSSLFFSAAALAGSFGGLLAAAIAKMKGVGGLPGWAWIFIIEGLATTLVGVFCWWMVFDWPETASFLNEDDRIRVQRRLIKDRQGRTAEDFDKRHIYAALKDWKTYGYMVIYGGCLTPSTPSPSSSPPSSAAWATREPGASSSPCPLCRRRRLHRRHRLLRRPHPLPRLLQRLHRAHRHRRLRHAPRLQQPPGPVRRHLPRRRGHLPDHPQHLIVAQQ
uniref:Major facilitator superfamily (MFS) profile domain-containing protein n=1 Tax=Bionectria ochroleuca TaxID=29856 RepID=A0A8H7N4Q1_BIOOC